MFTFDYKPTLRIRLRTNGFAMYTANTSRTVIEAGEKDRPEAHRVVLLAI